MYEIPPKLQRIKARANDPHIHARVNQASFSEPPAAPSPKGTQRCPQCPKQGNGPLQLKKHIDSDHGGSGNLQCSSCEFKTFSKNDLQDHVANTHNTGLANETNKSVESIQSLNKANLEKNSAGNAKNPQKKEVSYQLKKKFGGDWSDWGAFRDFARV